MDTAKRLMINARRAFLGFIASSSEIELKDILSELNSNELQKILNASKKVHEENLSPSH